MTDVDSSAPRNVVDGPILNSFYEEPERHYDFSGVTRRLLEQWWAKQPEHASHSKRRRGG